MPKSRHRCQHGEREVARRLLGGPVLQLRNGVMGNSKSKRSSPRSRSATQSDAPSEPEALPSEPPQLPFVADVLATRQPPHLLNHALCGVVDLSKPVADAAHAASSRSDFESPAATADLLQTHFKTTSRRVCCYMFKAGDLAFNCVQCQAHSTCVLCEPCFRESDHTGHDVTFFRVSIVGGCCDCGDTAAWKPEGFCSKHGRSLRLNDIFVAPGCVTPLMLVASSRCDWRFGCELTTAMFVTLCFDAGQRNGSGLY